VAALSALKLTGRVLVVLADDDGSPTAPSPTCPRSRPCSVGELNAYDILRSDWVVFTDDPARHARPPPGPSPRRAQRPRRPRGRKRATTAPDEAGTDEAATDEAADTTEDAADTDECGRRRPRGEQPMRDAMSVLIRPVVSEKSYALMDKNVYVFVVDPRATKIDVRHAVEQAFGVRVTTSTRSTARASDAQPAHQLPRPPPRHQAGHRHPAPDDSIDLFEN
jgi:large subunit ribosomal protein L23